MIGKVLFISIWKFKMKSEKKQLKTCLRIHQPLSVVNKKTFSVWKSKPSVHEMDVAE